MNLFHSILSQTILVVEILAYSIMVVTVARSIYHLVIVHRFDTSWFVAENTLTDGVMVALEFLMVAEVMKTMIAFGLQELLTLGIIIALRVFLSFVLRGGHGKVEKGKGERHED
ncbi:MAG: DUF1622 domain-containing protein [Peptoniphilaceae bacterium]|nr:DUF1622 domain-containing protein [Peptoniphilaceae bacterium]MDY6086165.1 DUF1622 domain-containing protein [Peptoniphilaceae bacterium]